MCAIYAGQHAAVIQHCCSTAFRILFSMGCAEELVDSVDIPKNSTDFPRIQHIFSEFGLYFCQDSADSPPVSVDFPRNSTAFSQILADFFAD
jgi:hypothetical protein